jgi:hypothetical protein
MDAGKLPTPVLQRSRCRTISRKRSQPSRRRRQCSRFSPARTATQSSTDSPPQSGRTHARAALRSSSKCWRAAKRSTHSSVGLNDHRDVPFEAGRVASRGGCATDQARRPPPSRGTRCSRRGRFPSGVIPEHWHRRGFSLQLQKCFNPRLASRATVRSPIPACLRRFAGARATRDPVTRRAEPAQRETETMEAPGVRYPGSGPFTISIVFRTAGAARTRTKRGPCSGYPSAVAGPRVLHGTVPIVNNHGARERTACKPVGAASRTAALLVIDAGKRLRFLDRFISSLEPRGRFATSVSNCGSTEPPGSGARVSADTARKLPA